MKPFNARNFTLLDLSIPTYHKILGNTFLVLARSLRSTCPSGMFPGHRQLFTLRMPTRMFPGHHQLLKLHMPTGIFPGHRQLCTLRMPIGMTFLCYSTLTSLQPNLHRGQQCWGIISEQPLISFNFRTHEVDHYEGAPV